MLRSHKRRTATRVKLGKTKHKNNHRLTPNYWNTAQKDLIIDVQKPGKGYKHFVKKRDLIQFISIIPKWNCIAEGLDAILLAEGGQDCDGWYNNNGVIAICAWEKEQDVLLHASYFEAHQPLFDRLNVKYEAQDGAYYCDFTAQQIKAYQLLHVLLHELGHHYDRINTKSWNKAARGEQFAEQFAFEYESQMLDAYYSTFGMP
ncbi:MAG: hypothetical protein AAGG75_15570 [Bacteroidota bacterium]